jgi:hypothetical protein
MKLKRSVLALLILICCAVLVLTTPPQRARAEESGNACDQCTTTKNDCLFGFGCGANDQQCRKNCNDNFGFCYADHCKPLIE